MKIIHNFVFILIILVLSNYQVLNVGGSGFRFPGNVIASYYLCFLLFAYIAELLYFRRVIYDSLMIKMGIALTVMLLPLLYVNKEFIEYHQYRIYTVIALPFAYIMVKRYFSVQSIILYIFIATLIQTFYGILQVALDDKVIEPFLNTTGDVAYGITQQVNIFAVYITIGSLIALSKISKSKYLYHNLFYSALVLVNTYLLFTRGSSEGETGIVIYFISLICFVFYYAFTKGYAKHFIVAGICIFTLLGATNYQRFEKVFNENLSFYNTPLGSRITIWLITADLIADSPVTGLGVGKFERAFAVRQGEFIQDNIYKKLKLSFQTSHPHNELLFWFVEMGILSFIGLLSLIIVVINHKFRKKQYFNLILMLPILMSTMLTLTFYLNLVLLVVLLMLFCLDENDMATTDSQDEQSRALQRQSWPSKNIGWYSILSLVALYPLYLTFVYTKNSFESVKGMTDFLINKDIESIRSISFPNTYENDIRLYLQAEKAMKDAKYTQDYVDLFGALSQRYVRKTHYLFIINYLLNRGDLLNAFRFTKEAAFIFPADKAIQERFIKLDALTKTLIKRQQQLKNGK